jgi:hypothetical protein
MRTSPESIPAPRVTTELWESTFSDHHNNDIPFKAKIDWTVNKDSGGYRIEGFEIEILEFTTENPDSIKESIGYLVSGFFHGSRVEWATEIIFK